MTGLEAIRWLAAQKDRFYIHASFSQNGVALWALDVGNRPLAPGHAHPKGVSLVGDFAEAATNLRAELEGSEPGAA